MRALFVGLAAAAASMVCAPIASADDLSVYAGYADNLRPSPFFPIPWLGDPNVVSQSSPNQIFDSGALRIDNTGANAITITNMTVELDAASNPVFFSIWNSLTINPGQTGIFTQNNNVDTQFDTSDYGFLTPAQGNANVAPAFPYGGCTNPNSPAQMMLCIANAPIITFTENGTAVKLSDTGNILDTFGYDLNQLNGADGNESINWNSVGAIANRGGTPEPATIVLLAAGLAVLAAGRKLRVRKV